MGRTFEAEAKQRSKSAWPTVILCLAVAIGFFWLIGKSTDRPTSARSPIQIGTVLSDEDGVVGTVVGLEDHHRFPSGEVEPAVELTYGRAKIADGTRWYRRSACEAMNRR